MNDPIQLFARWFDEAKKNQEIEPSAMTLATVNINYDVSARMVLLKDFDEKGFTFYTNYTSPKAKDLTEIPKAALVFWWPKSQKQIRITGQVQRLDAQASDDYFKQRPKESCISAMASKQSSVIPNKDYLIERFKKLEEKYKDISPIPRPDYWGGYLLLPQSIEFWQGKPHRLHDRFLYTKTDKGWQKERLAP